MALLGIDIGTTALKATLYSTEGEELARASLEYGSAGAGAELRPDSLWSALAGVVARVRRDAPSARIAAAAISSHGESFVAVDRDGRAIGPFVLNTAPIAVDEAADFGRRFGKQAIFERTGLPVHNMYTLPKIAWLRKNRPDVFAAADRFLCVEDYILTRAGVGSYISTSLASRTMGLDLERCVWSEDLLAYAGIEARQLAKPVASGTRLGRGSATACDELGLPVDIEWVAGGHDQGCCSLGAGGVAEGVAVDGTGTFECVTIPMAAASVSTDALRYNFPTERHTVRGMFLTLSYIAGGVALKWFRDTVSRHLVDAAATLDVDPYTLILDDLPEGPTDLLVFPHLIGTGTPWLDAGARGAVVGIGAGTTYRELAKAVLEGITLEMQWNLELQAGIGVHLGRIHAVGGGSRSDYWLQMKADIFGHDVVAVPGEASSAGAAMTAGVGIGAFRSYGEAAEAFVREGKVFSPRDHLTLAYRQKLDRHRDMARRIYGFESTPTM